MPADDTPEQGRKQHHEELDDGDAGRVSVTQSLNKQFCNKLLFAFIVTHGF
jgi:hypothetical protein